MKHLLFIALSFVSSALYAMTAQSYIVTDMEGQTIIQMSPDDRRSIASITKLFVAEQAIKLDQDEMIEITKDDLRSGQMRSTPLRVGKAYSRRQLTELALVSSDNVAAIALGRSAPPDTSYATLVESSGLNPENQSTARELANAARILYLTEIGRISVSNQTEIGRRHSTNPLLNKSGWEFLLSKTGFINQSGGCLVVILKISSQDRFVAISILGARNTKDRWQDLIEIRRILGDTDFYVPIKVNKILKKRKR